MSRGVFLGWSTNLEVFDFLQVLRGVAGVFAYDSAVGPGFFGFIDFHDEFEGVESRCAAVVEEIDGVAVAF